MESITPVEDYNDSDAKGESSGLQLEPSISGAGPSTERSGSTSDTTARQNGGKNDGNKDRMIDPRLTASSLMTVLKTAFLSAGVAGHHISSMNEFYQIGISQIATQIFSIEGHLVNERTMMTEDLDITNISFKVEFTNINIKPPVADNVKDAPNGMMTPQLARVANLTYGSQMDISYNITAKALLKNGTSIVRTAKADNQRIGSIPCLVGTELCNTSRMTRDQKKKFGEDPDDYGGYFVIGGSEWVVNSLENISNNTFHVHKNAHRDENARGDFISKPKDTFENMYQVVLRYLNTGGITIEMTTLRLKKIKIPFYLIFRAFGMSSDEEMVLHITHGAKDQAGELIMQKLNKAIEVEDPVFGYGKRLREQHEVVEYLSNKITEIADMNAAKKDVNVQKHLNFKVLYMFDQYLLPHVGTTSEHRIAKLRYLGHLINKLLRVYLGILDPTDRDSYRNKRIASAGTSIAKAFKTDFNKAIVMDIKRKLTLAFRTTTFSQVDLIDVVRQATQQTDLEKMLTQAITSGNKVIVVKRKEVTNRVASQILYRKNTINIMSTLRMIVSQNSSSASKQADRAEAMRKVQPSYVGFIDILQSPESGPDVGLSKQQCISAIISGSSSSVVLKAILLKDPLITKLENVPPEMISAKGLALVFVNGDWIGCCDNAHEIIEKYREERRHGRIDRYASIFWDVRTTEVYFWTDYGRLMRPLIIVRNNIEEYCNAARAGKPIEFSQWIDLTYDHIVAMQKGTLTLSDLVEQRIIEYISAEEQELTFLAASISLLREHQHDITRQYTHMDIEQALFGIISLSIPLLGHSSATRSTYGGCQKKQSAGLYANNYPTRIDKNMSLQWYCEKPLVSTFSDSLYVPPGHNCIIALMPWGQNQEDSIVFNQGSVDCGVFNMSQYNYEKAELDKNEQFGDLDGPRTMDIKRGAQYEFAQGGFVAPGTILQKNVVLVIKFYKIPKPDKDRIYSDRSVIYKKDEPAVVELVTPPTRNFENTLTVKVKWRSSRPLGVGDKLSSRTGNKGICGQMLPRCDMPYTEDGLIPDAIVNSHSIPTRMALNQIFECLLGIRAAMDGAIISASAFEKFDIDQVIEELAQRGVKFGGHRRMYSGITGCWLNSMIFIGPTNYQRLQKFVVDEHYSIQSGATNAMTRQPVNGKAHDGGLRVGEMEMNVYVASGIMMSLWEKFYSDSDGANIYICRNCGSRAYINTKMNMYRCKICKNNANIAKVSSSTCSNMLFNIMASMNVKTRFNLEPYSFPSVDRETD